MKFLSNQRFWLSTFFGWAITLFILSSFSKTFPNGGPDIPHIDKVLHFGYFMTGGYIFTTYLLLRQTSPLGWLATFILPTLVFSILGALDEYHQTFTPGRSGNDLSDWLADILGALTGILLANRLHSFLRKLSSPKTNILEN